MSKFDNTINNILNRLVFEQDETSTVETPTDETDVNTSETDVDQQEAPVEPASKEDAMLDEIERRLLIHNASYQAESKDKYLSGEEYVTKFIDGVKKMSPYEVNESSLGDDLSSAWDWMKEKGKKALEYIQPGQESLANFTVEKMDSILNYVLGEKFAKDLNDNVSESFLYKAVAIFFDPTGVLSWPYLKDATDAYEKNKDTEDAEIYQLNLLAAQLSVIPTFVFKPIIGILTLPIKLLFGTGAKVAEKIFGALGAKKIARGIAKWTTKKLPFRARPAKLSDRILLKAEKAAAAKASKAAKAGKLLPKVSKLVTGPIKGLVKNPFRTATVISSGNIPDTIKKWQEAGKGDVGKPLQRQRTLGSFPSFGEISTQRR